MRRLPTALVTLALVAAACSADTGTPATSSTATASTSSSTTTTAAATSTTSATTTTAAPTSSAATTTSDASTTTAASTTTTVPVITNPLPTLADGRPGTFLAVTTDYLAVEVDTATGTILQAIGQTGTPDDFTDDMEIAPNVLVGAWRTIDGTAFGLSECCEPAAGQIFYLEPGAELPPRGERAITFGWTLSPSPTGPEFAVVGYDISVVAPLPTLSTEASVYIDLEAATFASGMAAWSRDGSLLYWIGGTSGNATLNLIDLSAEPITSVEIGMLAFVGEGQWIQGVAMQASGNLVAFVDTLDSGIVDTDGVVFSTAGELIASFPVETGSTFGGYDPTGKFLIYVDRDGMVRWQGRGQSGVLGEGFIHASW